MRKKCGLTCMMIGALVIPTAALAQQSIRWQPTLDSAKRLAAQTNRLVLVHFWAGYCGGCRQMDQDLMRRPGVVTAVQSNFVPVKINVEHFPTTARQYGVTALPTEIILSPEGHVIEKFQGIPTAYDYVARLTRVVAARRGQGVEPYARYSNRAEQAAAAPAGPRYQPRPQDARNAPRVGTPNPPASPPTQAPPRARLVVPPMAAYSHQRAATQPSPPGQSGAALQRTSRQPPTRQPFSHNPPLGLDGHCPVQLCDDMLEGKRKWEIGDERWGAIHRGRTYLFYGPQQQRRFLDDPDRYAPVLSGNDVVLAVEAGRTVPGSRRHGAFFDGRIYLFANEDSLQKFDKNPQHYAAATLRAMGVRTAPNRQLR